MPTYCFASAKDRATFDFHLKFSDHSVVQEFVATEQLAAASEDIIILSTLARM